MRASAQQAPPAGTHGTAGQPGAAAPPLRPDPGLRTTEPLPQGWGQGGGAGRPWHRIAGQGDQRGEGGHGAGAAEAPAVRPNPQRQRSLPGERRAGEADALSLQGHEFFAGQVQEIEVADGALTVNFGLKPPSRK